ncbi:MAG: hypothetical protein M0D57_18405 [Sphingobacteriales bacterium JAD_PAG50586_3]|nr:MAG: hypothetical protein M0D57_18405 [Sphingobacteriales bacterium JAD_PAG50586_3]
MLHRIYYIQLIIFTLLNGYVLRKVMLVHPVYAPVDKLLVYFKLEQAFVLITLFSSLILVVIGIKSYLKYIERKYFFIALAYTILFSVCVAGLELSANNTDHYVNIHDIGGGIDWRKLVYFQAPVYLFIFGFFNQKLKSRN